MSAAILNAARNHRDAMVELTRQLVAIPTENPPGNFYPEAKQAILNALTVLRFEEIQVAGDCILCFTGRGQRTLHFSGHYDVVPAQSRDQFEPAFRGANLFGRGSSDMKGGLAAMIYAAIVLRDSAFDGRIVLVFVPDEETSGPRGSRFLVDQGLLGKSAIGMLTPEPTGGVIWNANRGAITLKVTMQGKSAHVGRQSDGFNAFERMIPVAQRLLPLKAQVETTGSILMLGGQGARNKQRSASAPHGLVF
jgi:acetylornithine deacetylase/succinyl-diaminopimelate desuccinylase-like protein